MIPDSYRIDGIGDADAKAYIKKYHYAHGCHGGPSPCYGLFDGVGGLFGGGETLGVSMFATPCSENVRASVFGPEYKDSVTELHRLHLLDMTPRNTESWMISRILKRLAEDRLELRAVVSFSDPTEGHTGGIYRATNALYYGRSGRARNGRDQSGRLRHPRQNGVMVDGLALGWTPEWREGKYRYLWLLGDKRTRRDSLAMLKVKPLPYPVNENDSGEH